MDRKRILIIEDDEDMCEELKLILEEEQYTVTVAFNGREGIEKVEEDGFDVILLDLKMPEINGVEVLQQIKTRDPLKKVIIITGSPLEEYSVLLHTLGPDAEKDRNILRPHLGLADRLFNKPFEIPELIAAIKEVTK